MRKLITLCTLLALTACGSNQVKFEEGSGYSQGEYRVTSFAIDSTPGLANDPEYLQLKPLLTQELLMRLQNQGAGREVGMTVTVQDVSLEINAGRAFLVGDQYRINSQVTLWDPATYSLIGSVFVGTQTGDANVLHAVLGDPRASESEYRRQIVSMYANSLLSAVYDKGK